MQSLSNFFVIMEDLKMASCGRTDLFCGQKIMRSMQMILSFHFCELEKNFKK